MKKKIVVYFFILTSVLILSGCSSKEEKTKVNEQSEKDNKEVAIKNDLIKKYNPVIFEDEKFMFSKDIQDKINENFLLSVDVMYINDLYDNNNKHFVKLSFNWDDSSGIFEINDEQLNFIRDNVKRRDIFGNFFVIVKIDKASKLSTPNMTGSISDDNDTGIYINSSDNFLLEGKLIDIQAY